MSRLVRRRMIFPMTDSCSLRVPFTFTWFLLFLAAWLSSFSGGLAAEENRVVKAPRVAEAPVIDGKLDDAVWRKGAWNEGFFPADPARGPIGTVTKFQVAVDDRFFYFAAVMDRPNGSEPVAEVTQRDGPVYRDDSVELLLHPVPAMDQYYHFVINSKGVVYDALQVQGGSLADRNVNLSLEVATQVGPDAWAVEMAIPLAELGLTREGGLQWALNVGRTWRGGKKPEISTFGRTEGSLHKPNQFVPVQVEALDVTPFLWKVTAQGESPVVEQEGRLFLETALSVANQTDSYVFFDLGFDVTRGEESLGKLSVPRGLDAGASRVFAVKIPISGDGDAMVDAAIRDSSNGAILSRLRYPARVSYTPLQLLLTAPSYRNTIYATQNLEAVRGTVDINLPEERLAGGDLAVRLENESGQPLGEVRLSELKRTMEFSLPLPAELAPGAYRVQAVLTLSQDGKVFESTAPLTRLGPPADGGNEVRLDQNLITLVNGKPFFPVGAMMVRPSEDLETVAAQGYTVVMEYTFYWWKDDARQAWLDRLQELGLKAVIYPYSKPEMAKGARLREPLSDEEAAGTRELILRWKDHPALLAWYLADEPELHSTLPLRLKQLDQLCRENDPYHPTIILNNTYGGIDTYAEYCDILMPNPFPGFYTGGGARRSIEYAYSLVHHAVRALGGTRAVWATPQAFSWADFREERANERPPSFEDLRNMYYQSIIAGSTGFIPYSYSRGRKHPSIRLGLGYMARELDLLKDPVLSPAAPCELTAPEGGVLHTLRNPGGQHYLFVVNVTNSPRTFTAKVPKAGRWYVISENQDLAPEQDGRLRDTLPPLATRLYTTNPSVARKLDLEKAALLIKKAPVLKDDNTPLPEAERTGLPTLANTP
jgi:hypothetical protein